MLRRDPELKSSWGTICPPTRMMAADGKIYKIRDSQTRGQWQRANALPRKGVMLHVMPIKPWSVVSDTRLYRMNGHLTISSR